MAMRIIFQIVHEINLQFKKVLPSVVTCHSVCCDGLMNQEVLSVLWFCVSRFGGVCVCEVSQ